MLTSSRVGEMTRAPKPSCGPHFFRNSTSSNGMRNDRVFPLPVRAEPSTSLPFNEKGMLRACMSVILTKNAFLRPFFVCADIGSSENSAMLEDVSYYKWESSKIWRDGRCSQIP